MKHCSKNETIEVFFRQNAKFQEDNNQKNVQYMEHVSFFVKHLHKAFIGICHKMMCRSRIKSRLKADFPKLNEKKGIRRKIGMYFALIIL